MIAKADKPLTAKQAAFIPLFADPQSDTYNNITQSMIAAGYEQKYANNNTNQVMVNNGVIKGINQYQAKIKGKSIATRAERQRFWSDMYRDENKQPSDRLRASELLGKSECDFVQIEVNLDKEIPTEPEAYKSWLRNELDRMEASTKVIEAYDKTDIAIAQRY